MHTHRTTNGRLSLIIAFLILDLATALKSQQATNWSTSSQQCHPCTASQLITWIDIVGSDQGLRGGIIPTGPVGSSAGGKWFAWTDDVKSEFCGTLKSARYFWNQDDKDWAFNIEPSSHFLSMLAYANSYGSSGHTFVHSEIRPDSIFSPGSFFPIQSGTRTVTSSLLEHGLCVYGPWVRDAAPDHNNQPEIHPAQLFWWRDISLFSDFYPALESWWLDWWGSDTIVHTNMWVLQDNSFRFNGLQFSAAWSVVPLRAEFWLPFEVDTIGANSKRYLVVEDYALNVVTSGYDGWPALVDSDDGKDHAIEFNGKTLLHVHEQQSDGGHLGVQFREVCLNQATQKMLGYVVLTTRVGSWNSLSDGLGGHAFHVLGPWVGLGKPMDVPPLRDLLKGFSFTPLYSSTTVHVPHFPWTDYRWLIWSPHRLGHDIVGDIVLQPTDSSSRPPAVHNVRLRIGNSSVVSRFRSQEDRQTVTVGENVAITKGFRATLELGSGSRIVLSQPRLGVWPIIRSHLAVSEKPVPNDWDIFTSATRLPSTIGNIGREQLVRSLWQILTVEPRYAPLGEDAEIASEETSRLSETLNASLDSAGLNQISKLDTLFNTRQPFRISWTFRGTNITSGNPVGVVCVLVKAVCRSEPIRLGKRDEKAEIRVAFGGRWMTNQIHVQFPTTNDIYRLDVEATVTDVFGTHGTSRYSVWSHFISASPDSLLTTVRALASRVTGLQLDSLLTQGTNSPDLITTGRSSSTRWLSRMASKWASDASSDGRLTPEEFEQLLHFKAVGETKD